MEEVDDCMSLEWTIVNFSCWNSEVHGEVIRSPSFSLTGYRCCLRLYPRGFDDGENLAVEWKNNEPVHFGFHSAVSVSLISSNGSVIRSQQIGWANSNGFTLTFPSLKFRDLVAQIKKNDALDQLSVLFRRSWSLLGCRGHKDYVLERVRTTIDVHDVSVKIPSEKFDELFRGDCIQVIQIFLYDDSNDRVQINLYEKDNSYTSILTFFSQSKKKFFVSTRTSVLHKDALLKTVDYESVLKNDGEKKTLISVTKEEVKKKHCSLFISLKIIPSDSSEIKGRFRVGKGIYLMPPNFLISRRMDERSPISNCKIATASPRPNNEVAVLSKELMCLFRNQDFSDFQLKCGGVSLPAHKNILCARSPVFKRLLSSDMREAASGAVDIEDLDATTLARFLVFLYTGTVEDLEEESALKLYYAADKYEVLSLKSKCVSVLCASVSVPNVSDILTLADRHQDGQLIRLAHDFILRNFDEVLGSPEWESFLNREPLLVEKTMTAVAREKNIVKTSTS